jgi:hypothetical protein
MKMAVKTKCNGLPSLAPKHVGKCEYLQVSKGFCCIYIKVAHNKFCFIVEVF